MGSLSTVIRVDVGPRGVGKTSLLRASQLAAEADGFVTVWVTAGDGPLLDALTVEFGELARTWTITARNLVTAAINSLTLSIGPVNISGSALTSTTEQPMRGPGRALQDLLRTATTAAVESGASGLVVFIDEIQAADATSLRSLAYAWQHMQSEDASLRAACFTAGLSHSQEVISRAASFAERFDYQRLTNLTDEASIEALSTPSERSGVTWSTDALRAAHTTSANYPYFVQVIGNETWKAAGYPTAGGILTKAHVDAARIAFSELQLNFFGSRWNAATDGEQRFLVAMARNGGVDVRRRDIADALGVETTAISMTRASLLAKGLIEDRTRGKLSFTAPGFTEYILVEVLDEGET
ncbi:hypothetical protein nbrc107696_13350 [Gordonia spumicola]|uniref:Orc1-like AAA ATPase domain-containing protein n=2 Tax=Gordonia spumicola TaxID=589161 RepID=A0A7I9V629_9ACTN|nr:hypothetical protein nbrc107696_13350 [Gordonia spumicola]